MATVKYNFDDNLTIKNKLTQHKFINDVVNKKIQYIRPYSGKKVTLANFYMSELVWNDSSKDIDSITLNGTGGKTEYTLSSNAGALKNRIFKEANPCGCTVLPSSTDKKFMAFAVNDLLFEFVELIVYQIQNDTLPKGKDEVTLTITSADTETLTNGQIIVTAKDESNTAIQGLTITGTAGEVEISGTTNSSGQVTTDLTDAGEYAVSVESAETTAYKSASKTGTVTATVIEVETDAEPGES